MEKKKRPNYPKNVPLPTTELARKPYGWQWIMIFCMALAVFAGSAYFARKGTAYGWEQAWFHFVNNWSERWYGLMAVITFMGSTWFALVAVLLPFIFKMYRLAWRLSFTILGAYAIVLLAKHVVDRERPLGLFADVHARVVETGMGFPSGHATLITIVMLTLMPYLPRIWRWFLPVPVLLVCLSRLYLGVHVPLDILGGIALGTGAVAFVRILPQKLRSWGRL